MENSMDDQRPTADEDAEYDRKATERDPRYPARKAACEALERYVSEWIDGYELDDGEVSHSPSELEQLLILDAFNGLTGDEEYQRLYAAWRALCQTPEEKLYRATLAMVEKMVAADPEPGSVTGALLDQLSSAVEAYEKAKFPLPRGSAIGGVAPPPVQTQAPSHADGPSAPKTGES
jgi:hypothetical protein